MTMKQSLGISAFFAVSISLIVLGTTSNIETVLWGIPLHIRLAKAIGLIMLLGSIIAALVMYGSSLTPTRSELERRAERTNHESRQETPRAPEKETWNKSGRETQSALSPSEGYREQAHAKAA
jgi:hypothetical protein